MRHRERIIHKALTLVAVPLMFGLVFVFLLFAALTISNQRFQHELLLKDAMIADDVVTRRIAAARIGAVAFYISKDKFFEDAFTENMREAALGFKYLEKVLKNERTLRMPLQVLRDEIVSSNRGYRLIMHAPFEVGVSDLYQIFGDLGVSAFFSDRPAFALMERLQRLATTESHAVLNSMNILQMILIGGMVLSIVLSILLTIFFCLGISNRLLIIVNNTISLSKGTALTPPLTGSDEIAELDHFLYTSAREIRELERFKKEMIGVVSHELKSPLSSVSSFLSSLRAGVFGEISDKFRDRVDRTSNSVTRLMGLVKELLDLDRLELELNPEPISVDELVKDSIDTVQELADKLAVELKSKIEAESIVADRNRIVQVMVNFLSNALKFSPAGEEVTIETKQNQGYFECRVIDRGRGIPEEFRKQIFEPFKQVDATDATSKKGTGLGLTISRSIIEQHGGTIGVDSVEGEGSTFWFKIPSSPSQSAEAAGKALSQARRTPQSGRTGVLQKGLVIIAVPLVFQFVFVSVLGYLLYQVQGQIKLEERSKEIVDTLNRREERLLVAANDGLMYIYTQKQEFLRAWTAGRKETLQLNARVKELANADPEQLEDIKKSQEWLDKIVVLLDKMMSLKTEKELKNFATVMEYAKKNNIIEQMKLLFEGQGPQENLMAREKAKGEELAAERIKMINTVELWLGAAVVLNVILSTFLAFYLIRNLTSRLQHVAGNTARLVKREELDLPAKGSDEIAYLDRMLYDTGKRLIELETFKRELISIVSHELRTPLLSVSGTLEVLGSGALGELSQKGKSRLQMAKEESARLIRLINDLLDIEKMEAGKFVLDLSEISAKDPVDTSIAAVLQLAETKKVKLESFVDAKLTLKADRDRLCQVLINLLSNAIKFSPEDGVIRVLAEQSDLKMEFKVIDQGRGIPEELRTKIFDRFVQVEKADASERGGSGLGLAIARAIVEQHGGEIGVDSRIGAGSTFWFRLPIKQDAVVQ